MPTDGARKQVARSIAIDTFWKEGTTYRVTAWLKGEKDNRNNGLTVSAITPIKGKYKSFGGCSLKVPPAREGWKRVSREFTIGKGAQNLRFMLDAYGGTSFLADGIAFEEKLPDGTFRPVARTNSGDKQEMLAFVERWIRLYRGEGRKWLAHGRQLHPPKIDCESVAYHENFRGTEIDNVKPVVFGTALRHGVGGGGRHARAHVRERDALRAEDRLSLEGRLDAHDDEAARTAFGSALIGHAGIAVGGLADHVAHPGDGTVVIREVGLREDFQVGAAVVVLREAGEVAADVLLVEDQVA